MILKNGFASQFFEPLFWAVFSVIFHVTAKSAKSLTSCQSFLVTLFLAFI